MDFRFIRDNLNALEAAVSSGNFSDMLKTFRDVVGDESDCAKYFRYSETAVMSAREDPIAAECLVCLDRIKARVPEAAAALDHPTKSQGNLPGNLADGTAAKVWLAALPDQLNVYRLLLKG